jgi:DNA-directed RNA polymerase specialized sigma24 family protein
MRAKTRKLPAKSRKVLAALSAKHEAKQQRQRLRSAEYAASEAKRREEQAAHAESCAAQPLGLAEWQAQCRYVRIRVLRWTLEAAANAQRSIDLKHVWRTVNHTTAEAIVRKLAAGLRRDDPRHSENGAYRHAKRLGRDEKRLLAARVHALLEQIGAMRGAGELQTGPRSKWLKTERPPRETQEGCQAVQAALAAWEAASGSPAYKMSVFRQVYAAFDAEKQDEPKDHVEGPTARLWRTILAGEGIAADDWRPSPAPEQPASIAPRPQRPWIDGHTWKLMEIVATRCADSAIAKARDSRAVLELGEGGLPSRHDYYQAAMDAQVEALPGWKRRQALDRYFLVVGRNACVSVYREAVSHPFGLTSLPSRRRPLRRVPLEALDAEVDAFTCEGVDAAIDLRRALARLRERQRVVLELLIEGYSLNEIAERLSIGRATAQRAAREGASALRRFGCGQLPLAVADSGKKKSPANLIPALSESAGIRQRRDTPDPIRAQTPVGSIDGTNEGRGEEAPLPTRRAVAAHLHKSQRVA